MTLELRVPFFEKEDAIEFQRYLKKNGCQSRIETITEFEKMFQHQGTIRNIEAFLDGITHQNSITPYLEEGVKRCRTWIDEYKTDINALYAKCEIGVEYDKKEDIYQGIFGVDIDLLMKDAESLEDDEQSTYDNTYDVVTRLIQSFICLERNDCLHEDMESNKITFTQKKPVEDLEVHSAGGYMFGRFNFKELINAGISVSMSAITSNSYTVISGPEFLLLNSDDLIEYVSDSSCDDEEQEEDPVVSHIQLCSILVHRILDTLKEGPVTSSEVIEKLFIDPEEMPVLFDMADDAMDSILNDLKKLELISFKNGMVKLAR